MDVIFFTVEGTLSNPNSDAVAPSGAKGVAEANVKKLRNIVESNNQARLVLCGEWKNKWDFLDEKCTPDGIYLNKKLARRGLHILDKTKDVENDLTEWLNRHPNVMNFCILGDVDANQKWMKAER